MTANCSIKPTITTVILLKKQQLNDTFHPLILGQHFRLEESVNQKWLTMKLGKKHGIQQIVTLFTVTVMAVIIFPFPVSPQSIAPDNLISTLQITIKLCYVPGVSSEKVAWQFFGCYDGIPGRQLFIKCQKRTFNGVLFDSVRSIKQNCRQPLKIPTYASCLRREFMKAGLDMNKSVRKLNACQLPVLR